MIDRDGMRDAWETSRRLDPDNAADRNGDDDTKFEEYLKGLVGS